MRLAQHRYSPRCWVGTPPMSARQFRWSRVAQWLLAAARSRRTFRRPLVYIPRPWLADRTDLSRASTHRVTPYLRPRTLGAPRLRGSTYTQLGMTDQSSCLATQARATFPPHPVRLTGRLVASMTASQ